MSVKNFLANHNCDPLHFIYNAAYSTIIEEIPIKNHKELTLEQLVETCLELTYNYCSYNSKNERETIPGRRRSALDIFRHVIYFRPEINIYQVMNTLYQIRNRLCYKFVCHNIERRVFHPTKYSGSTYCDECYMNEKDEFGLSFFQWENISEETDK